MTAQVVFPTFFQPRLASSKRLHALAPRMAPSALRVPMPANTVLPLKFFAGQPQVFVHEGARQALERRLEQAHLGPVVLHISDNVSRMVTFARRGEQLRVRVHHMFLDAPPAVREALVRYVVNADDRLASQLVGRFIADNHFRIRASRPPSQPLRTKGEAHDLLAVFKRLNERYFNGAHDALISWGRVSPRRETKCIRRSIKLGSYSVVQRLIRVHPVLDRAWVPRYFVEYIAYHEMIHHVLPFGREGGRALLHSREFREREQQFHAFERAMKWEREHLGRVLRA